MDVGEEVLQAHVGRRRIEGCCLVLVEIEWWAGSKGAIAAAESFWR
jgi:hypothetical protein